MAERSLDSATSYVPRTIQEFLSELSAIRDVSVRSSKLDDFLKGLEEEMRKIYVFKRELPISIVLIKDAITTLKEESIQLMRGKRVKPVLEQFIPLTKIPDEVDDEDEDDDGIKKEKDNKDKKNWLRSAQLWKTDDFSSSSSGKRHNNPDSRTTKINAEFGFHPYHSSKNKSGSRTFMSIKGYPFFSAAAAAAARHEQEDADEPISSLSLIIPGTKNSKELNRPKAVLSRSSSSPGPTNQLSLQAGMTSQPLHHQHQQQNNNGRKQRRCWSQELHRRFLNALQQLGGSHASTPKQIRELMQVENLTNDEVKSHLQKYRLHTKRVPDSSIKAPILNLGESSSKARDEFKADSSKQSNSQSGSPQGPLDLPGTGGNNNSMELVGDEISESYNWKNQLHRRSAQDDDEEEEEGDDGDEEEVEEDV